MLIKRIETDVYKKIFDTKKSESKGASAFTIFWTLHIYLISKIVRTWLPYFYVLNFNVWSFYCKSCDFIQQRGRWWLKQLFKMTKAFTAVTRVDLWSILIFHDNVSSEHLHMLHFSSFNTRFFPQHQNCFHSFLIFFNFWCNLFEKTRFLFFL